MRWRALLVFVVFDMCESRPRPADPVPPASASPALTARPSSPTPLATSDGARVKCARDESFPTLWHVSEASAAAEVELSPGARELLVVSDSGNHGEAMLWGIPRGPFRPIRLPLDPGASDDLEGAAWTGGHLYTLTSSGAVRRFSPDGKGGLARDRDAYPLGPAPAVCAALTDANCGNNYEGLCLRPFPTTARCAGYAASKTTGKLHCLVFDPPPGPLPGAGRLRLDPIKPPLQLDVRRHALSDCAFGAAGGPAQGTLLVTTNVYGGSTTYLVDEATGALSALDVPGLLNNEAVAVDRDGTLYQLMDSNTDSSLASRMTCEGWR